MADPADPAAATAAEPSSTPKDAPTEGDLAPDERKAVESADKPDEVRQLISAANRRARHAEGELKSARLRLQELQDVGKSETEQLAGRAERAESRAAELERSLLVERVAAKHSIPVEHVHRLAGSSEEELEADARALAKLFPKEEQAPADLGAGARGGATPPGSRGFSDQIRRQAQRRR